MKNEVKLIKNTLILSLGTFFPKCVSIITIPILTAGLTQAEYGTYDLITTLVSLLLPILTLQIQSAAFRFLIECRGNERRSSEIVTNIFAVTLPISIISLVCLYAILDLSSLIKILICVYYFLDILFLAIQQIARGIGRNSYYSISTIIVSTVNLITTLIFISGLDCGLIGVLLSLTISYGVALVFLCNKVFSVVKVGRKYVSRACIKEMLAYSWPMVPNNLSSWVLSLSDRLVITAFVGIEANAVYAVANKLPNLFYALQNTFTLAWQENASEVAKEDDVSVYYSRMFDSFFRFICGLIAVIIGCTPLLFRLLIRGSYDAAYIQIPILFLGCMFSSFSSFFGGIYVAFKKTKSIGMTTIFAAVVNLGIDLLMVGRIGITAGSISTLISYLFLTIYRMLGVRKCVDLKYNFKIIIASFIVVVVMCVLCVQRTNECNVINFICSIVFALTLNWEILCIISKIIRNKVNITVRK